MVSLRLILATACLPVIEAAVRILRTAHEFGRSTLRFRATSNNLKRLDLDLQKPTDSPAKLEILQKVEEVLKAERREWLRLMFEADGVVRLNPIPLALAGEKPVLIDRDEQVEPFMPSIFRKGIRVVCSPAPIRGHLLQLSNLHQASKW